MPDGSEGHRLRYRNIKLFKHLPMETLLERLTRLAFSTGEFPKSRQVGPGFSLCDQVSAFSLYNGGRYSDGTAGLAR
jgi:hypothetical protein